MSLLIMSKIDVKKNLLSFIGVETKLQRINREGYFIQYEVLTETFP